MSCSTVTISGRLCKSALRSQGRQATASAEGPEISWDHSPQTSHGQTTLWVQRVQARAMSETKFTNGWLPPAPNWEAGAASSRDNSPRRSRPHHSVCPGVGLGPTTPATDQISGEILLRLQAFSSRLWERPSCWNKFEVTSDSKSTSHRKTSAAIQPEPSTLVGRAVWATGRPLRTTFFEDDWRRYPDLCGAVRSGSGRGDPAQPSSTILRGKRRAAAEPDVGNLIVSALQLFACCCWWTAYWRCQSKRRSVNTVPLRLRH